MKSKKNKIKKKFIKLRCSPKTKKKGYTCYSDESLLKLKKFWNARHPDATINTNNSFEIWQKLRNSLSNVCESESCWLKQKFISNNLDKNLLNYTFAPKAPESWKKDKNTWLSSIDIEKVMKQYEDAFPNFAFIGPSPIDFDTPKVYNTCVWDDLCKFNLSSFIKKNKTNIGIIFNTDPHYKGGSHWVGMYIDLKKQIIFYFDSVGDAIPNEILKLVKKIQIQGKELGLDLKFDSNYKFDHQKGNTECGMYVLYFIIEVLENKKDLNFFKTNRITDEQMEDYRKIFFN